MDAIVHEDDQATVSWDHWNRVRALAFPVTFRFTRSGRRLDLPGRDRHDPVPVRWAHHRMRLRATGWATEDARAARRASTDLVGVKVDELGTILGVWAHPDDETYLTAGLMARAVRNGSRIVCVTATRGEGGSMDEERWPPETMGEVRTAEMERSLAILGVTEHHWLDLPDVDMDTALPEEGYQRVRTLVAEVRPDTILTFGPDGMTGHEAHRSVSRWATRALLEAGEPGARVLYATATPEWAEEFLPIWGPFEVFRPGTPELTPRDELAIDFELPPDLLRVKVDAILAHESQVQAIFEAVGEDVWWREMATEFFRLGAVKEA